MQDEQQNQVDQQQQAASDPPQDGILNQTFGEVLQNKEAQERIMKAMHISPEQFQQLLKSTEGNPLTDMTVGQLFKTGFVQQAVKAQGGNMPQMEQVPQQQKPASNVVEPNVSDANGRVEEQMQSDQVPGEILGPEEGQELDPEQFQQMVDSGNAQVLETDEMGNPTKIAVEQHQPEPEFQKQSWWDMIKSAFK